MKYFIVSVILSLGVFGNVSLSNAEETIPGFLEVSWDISWECSPPCMEGVELRKKLHARFYPRIVPKEVRNLSPGKGIVIDLPAMTQESLLKLATSIKNVPENFMRHRERFWRAEAELSFSKGIQSFMECDVWNYTATDVVIKNVDDTAFSGDDLFKSCGSNPYDEVFSVVSRISGQKVFIKSETDIDSVSVAEIGSEDFVLKLETMGDGFLWLKVKHLRYSDIIGYLYLPDVTLSLLN